MYFGTLKFDGISWKYILLFETAYAKFHVQLYGNNYFQSPSKKKFKMENNTLRKKAKFNVYTRRAHNKHHNYYRL